MAKFNISEETIRKVTEKYVKSVKRDPAKIPDIRKVISEAIRDAAPDRDVKDEDISAVIHELSSHPIINDKIISEAAKKVADHNANEDLIFSINTYAKQLRKKVSEKDVEEIIKAGKLNPYSSTPFQIKNAVRDYFEGARPVEAIPQEEIRDVIKTELAKDGPIDERDVAAVLQKYLKKADPEKPLRPEDIRDVIKQHLADKPKTGRPEPVKPEPIEVPQGPQPTPVNRPETPQDEPEEPEGPTAPPPRTGAPTPPITPGEEIPPKDKKNLTFFEKVRSKMYRYGIKSLTTGARNWLRDTITKAKTVPNRNKLLKQGQSVHEAMIGRMFLYFYDAKLKEDLPYWDKFPLIICTDITDDGWYGLNLHYLPIPLRMQLFDALLKLADNASLDTIERLRISYGLLRGFSKFPEAKPCFKRYLSGYVKSDLLLIEPVDWEIACFIPVEQFQKQAKEAVWKESRKIIKKNSVKKKR